MADRHRFARLALQWPVQPFETLPRSTRPMVFQLSLPRNKHPQALLASMGSRVRGLGVQRRGKGFADGDIPRHGGSRRAEQR